MRHPHYSQPLAAKDPCLACGRLENNTHKAASFPVFCRGPWWKRLLYGCPRIVHVHQYCVVCGYKWTAELACNGHLFGGVQP